MDDGVKKPRLRERIARWFAENNRMLCRKYRCYAVLAAAYADFRGNALHEQTYFFTFNAFLGVLALAVAITSLLGFISSVEFKKHIVDGIMNVFPIFRGPADPSLNVFKSYRGVMGVISLGFLIWAGTRISDALERAFSRVWRTEPRRFGRKKLVGLLMILVIGGLFLLTFTVQLGFSNLWESAVHSRGTGYYLGVTIAKPVIGLFIDFLMFLFIFQVVPVVRPRLRHCAAGAVLIAAIFLGTQYLMNLYFDFIYRVPVIYGSLASAVILLLWLQLTGLMTFYGAEVVYALGDRQLVGDYVESL